MGNLSAASLSKLYTCDKRLQLIILEAADIIPIVVVTGHRDQISQELAFKEGKTQKHWPEGNHNSFPSRAADLAADIDPTTKDKIEWGDVIMVSHVMGVVRAVAYQHNVKLRFGFDWNGNFLSVGPDPDESFLDAFHVELLGD